MPTNLILRPTAPAVRRKTVTRYVESLVNGEWQRLTSHERRDRHPTAPSVVVRRTETRYKEPIGTQGEKSHVVFVVTGDRRADYFRDGLPTIAPHEYVEGEMIGTWYY